VIKDNKWPKFIFSHYLTWLLKNKASWVIFVNACADKVAAEIPAIGELRLRTSFKLFCLN